MMRSVSFVDRVELNFSGNHFCHAIAIGDVDADGLNELVVGNFDGDLAIFKGRDSNPLKKCSGLGTITCVGIGDLFNMQKNIVVCINTEGVCHLIDLSADSGSIISRTNSISSTTSSVSPEHVDSKQNSKFLSPVHTQTLADANIKTMCIAKVSPQGVCDLVVGHTDRCLAVYQWCEQSRSLEIVEKFKLSGQVGSISVSVNKEGNSQFLISQPGGTYEPLYYSRQGASEDTSTVSAEPTLVLGNIVGQPQRRNPTSSTEIIGQIIDKSSRLEETTDPQHCDIIGLCTLDGTIRMLKDEVKQWELQVDHSLFSIQKLDMTGDGSDEIVVCAWDGMTYFVDQKRNITRYKFEQTVTAFTAGYYGILEDGKHNKPCLIYTTFTNHIFIYYNITLPAISSSNLFQAVLQHPDVPNELHKKLKDLDDGAKQKLFQECLYKT